MSTSNVFDPGDGTAQAIRIVNRDGTAISAGGGGGTSSTDDAPFTVAASSGTPAGGIVTADSVDAGDFGVFAMLANRQQKITLFDSTGVEITSFGGGTEYTEDAASAADPKGGMLILRRRDTLSATEVSTDGDNIAASATSKGELYVKQSDPLPAGTNAIGKLSSNAGVTIGAVEVAAAQTLATVTTVGTVTNLSQLAGTAIAMGTGVRSAGTQRVTVATDDVVPVSGTVAVSGTVVVDSELTTADLDTGAGTDTRAVVGLAGAASGGAVLVGATAGGALKGDLTTIAGTAPTTVGKLDVKGADGDVFVRQATAANLNATVSLAAAQTLATVSTVTNLSQLGGAAVAMNTGVRAAGVQRVTIATDDLVPVSGTVSVNTHDVGAITTSVTPGTGAAHLGKAEDAAHTSGDTGVMAFAVRRDANTSLVDTTGDYAPFQVDASGSLKVAIISGAGSGGTALADNAAFTPGTTSFTPIGGEVDDVASTDATENSAGIVRMTTKRAIHVNLRDATGAELAVGGGTQYDEDAVSAGAEKVTMAGVVRRDAAASSSGTDGDISTLAADATGRLWTRVGTIDGGTVTTVGTVTNLAQIGGAAVAMGTGTRSAGTLRVTVATDDVVPASQSGTWTVQPGNTPNTTAWLVADQAATAGGCSVTSFLSTAAVQTTQIKGSAGQVYGLHFFNVGAAAVYGRLYNQTGAPASTDTANIVYRFVVPGNTAGAGVVIPIPPGVAFGTGIGWRISAAIADNDTTVLAVNGVIGNVVFK